MPEKKLFHEPVLKKEILACLLFSEVETVFDGTVGLGGHAEAILEAFPNIKQYLACDLDKEHLLYAKKRLAKWEKKLSFHHQSFSSIKSILQPVERKGPLVILLDLGLCSSHVDRAEKGFSFAVEGPLSMCFDPEAETSAEQILSSSQADELEWIFRAYGEIRHAQKLARAIVEARGKAPFTTTTQLRLIIEQNTHPKERKKTVTQAFQALRIAVNNELEVLTDTLALSLQVMRSGDRMGVISYHSLEDRIVKQFFGKQAKPKTVETDFSLHTEVAPPVFQLLTKKPILPSQEEIDRNPRSRSARFRMVEKRP